MNSYKLDNCNIYIGPSVHIFLILFHQNMSFAVRKEGLSSQLRQLTVTSSKKKRECIKKPKYSTTTVMYKQCRVFF
jgi:hypothetical protein